MKLEKKSINVYLLSLIDWVLMDLFHKYFREAGVNILIKIDEFVLYTIALRVFSNKKLINTWLIMTPLTLLTGL